MNLRHLAWYVLAALLLLMSYQALRHKTPRQVVRSAVDTVLELNGNDGVL